jgi:hypothetical protein
MAPRAAIVPVYVQPLSPEDRTLSEARLRAAGADDTLIDMLLGEDSTT